MSVLFSVIAHYMYILWTICKMYNILHEPHEFKPVRCR